ncbi:ATP-binding protein [Streptomyces sp. NPDC004749]|uniref:hypothetical protein n=1 Tax=unclassified Streptomyces TaxID=2593676 RepID=UPI0004C50C36|nr:hypothetical protein [Streptomyces sp. NRRL F-5135]
MSLSLTRRIARTALIVAAGAAPVLGAAGAANAAALPESTGLGAVSALDGGTLGDTVGKTAGSAGEALGGATTEAGKTTGQVGALGGGLSTDGLSTDKLPIG